jgi:hypothetical protein
MGSNNYGDPHVRLSPASCYFILLGPNVFLSTQTNKICLFSSSMWETNSHIHTNRSKNVSFIFSIHLIAICQISKYSILSCQRSNSALKPFLLSDVSYLSLHSREESLLCHYRLLVPVRITKAKLIYSIFEMNWLPSSRVLLEKNDITSDNQTFPTFPGAQKTFLHVLIRDRQLCLSHQLSYNLLGSSLVLITVFPYTFRSSKWSLSNRVSN